MVGEGSGIDSTRISLELFGNGALKIHWDWVLAILKTSHAIPNGSSPFFFLSEYWTYTDCGSIHKFGVRRASTG